MENRRLILPDCEVERGLFWVEDATPKRIGREQSIPSRVPVGWVTRIIRAVEYCNGYRAVPGVSGKRAPAPTCRPGCFSLNPLAGKVNAGSVRSVGRIYFGGPSTCIHENAALFIG